MIRRKRSLLITCFLSALCAAASQAGQTDPGGPVGPVGPAVQAVPSGPRQQQLLRMLRQDCGSCHGMQLKGGLGPALNAEALRDLPPEGIAATILHGRPGTPMPPWKSMISAAEADWLARLLQQSPSAASGTESSP